MSQGGADLQPNLPATGTAAAPPRSAGYLPTLDGWRAIAVLLVIGSHTSRDGHDHWYNGQAVLGVEIFFGISGFLICTRLLDEYAQRGQMSLSGFYLRRAFRILPAAWLYLLALAAMYAFDLPVLRSWSELAACVFLYRNYIPEDAGNWYTGHFWSLMVEEHFYLIFPALLVLVRPRRAVWVLPLIAAAFAAWRVLDDRTGLLTDLLPGVFRTRRTDLRFGNLLWGCWIALVVFYLPPNRSRPVWILVGSVALAVVACSAGKVITINGFIRGALIPLFLVSTVLSPQGPLGRLLEWAPVRWVGKISYSLYLWQQLFFVMASSVQLPQIRAVQDLPWNLLLVFTCASVSYYLVERPLIRVGHRLAKPVTPGRT